MNQKLLLQIKASHKRKPLVIYGRVNKRITYLMSNMKARTEKVGKTMIVTKNDIFDLVSAEYGMACKYCQTQLTYKNYVCDHILPLSRGGESEKENLQIICKTCNTQKGPMFEDEYLALIALINTFTKESRIYAKRKLSKAGI